MDALQIFALVLALVLSHHGAYRGQIAELGGPAYASLRFPPGSSATFAQVDLGGLPAAACETSGGLALCSSTTVDVPPGPIQLDVASDGAWELRIYVTPRDRLYLPVIVR